MQEQYANIQVQVVATKHSLQFYDAAAVPDCRIWQDEDEWNVSRLIEQLVWKLICMGCA